MYVFVAMPPRTLILADAYANALVRSLTPLAGAPPAVQRGGSPDIQGTTIAGIDQNERSIIDSND
jgi:hypothetical protein